MKKSTPLMVEIIINAVISLILYNVAAYSVFKEDNPFAGNIQGFFAFFAGLSLLDMLWKLIRNQIKNRRKK
ncbi:MAG: hypothetical protein FWH10_05630 [Oscillospiraceae bacterium]|nr:hypothetical protein [Oscillospiraceae bacterium]